MEPIEATEQGGFGFDYQCGSDGVCRIYQIRNHPGKPDTPVRWKSAAEIFIDTVLVPCPASAKTCEWLTIPKKAWNKSYDCQTNLDYGLNKDSYHEKPQGFCEPQRQIQPSGLLFPLETAVSGTITDAEGKPLLVGLEVSSAAKKSSVGFELSYTIRSLRETAPVTVATGSSFEGRGLGVTWDAAQSPAFAEKVGAIENNNVQGNRFVAVSVTTGAIEIKSGLLTIWDHGKAILQTTAAAYRPKPQ